MEETFQYKSSEIDFDDTKSYIKSITNEYGINLGSNLKIKKNVFEEAFKLKYNQETQNINK